MPCHVPAAVTGRWVGNLSLVENEGGCLVSADAWVHWCMGSGHLAEATASGWYHVVEVLCATLGVALLLFLHFVRMCTCSL